MMWLWLADDWHALNASSACICVTCLIEKDIFPVSALSCELLHDALWADAMLSTKLLPKLKTNCTETIKTRFISVL